MQRFGYLSRRSFLQTSAALAAATAVPSWRGRAAEDSQPGGKELGVRSARPFNAEPELAALVAGELTPVKHIYVRNHGPTPKLEERDFRLRIEGLVHKPRELSLAELQRLMPQGEQEATLTCAGNRRRE